MATSVRSRKAKGRRLQNWVRDVLLSTFPNLKKDEDVSCAIMGESGIDVKLSRFAQGLFPFSIECKNKETWKGLYDAYDQAISNANLEPVVVAAASFLPNKETCKGRNCMYYLRLCYLSFVF